MSYMKYDCTGGCGGNTGGGSVGGCRGLFSGCLFPKKAAPMETLACKKKQRHAEMLLHAPKCFYSGLSIHPAPVSTSRAGIQCMPALYK